MIDRTPRNFLTDPPGSPSYTDLRRRVYRLESTHYDVSAIDVTTRHHTRPVNHKRPGSGQV